MKKFLKIWIQLQKLIEKIFKNLDTTSKSKLEGSIKTLLSDEDPDVKYFASKFMGSDTPK